MQQSRSNFGGPSRGVATCMVLFMCFVTAGCGVNADSTSIAELDTKNGVNEDPAAVANAATINSSDSGRQASGAADVPATKLDRSTAGPLPIHPFPRRIPSPSIDGGVAWFNTAKPLTLTELRGKFVLLDFWTYCCINCMHVLPELKKLEAAYPNELVVVGVHSAKFTREKESQNIRAAVMRHEITHPVVNDAKQRIWNRFGVQSWPTLILIDPEGKAVWAHSGEIEFAELDAMMRRGLPYYLRKGVLDTTPRSFALESDTAGDMPLRYPGKVLADERGGRLFIADTGHNRIVIADLDGKLRDVVGTGQIGRSDGPFDQCTFDHPHGMALKGHMLYVADTENHLIRRVDLDKRQVTTIAGTGSQGRLTWPGWDGATNYFGRPTNLPKRFVGPPRATPLNTPWALAIKGDRLLIAMAGAHQIWQLALDRSELGPFAGNGREDIVDGTLLPAVPFQSGYASFAQPSGLTTDDRWLYVADSEGSSIRAVPLDGKGQVRTIVGSAQLPAARLFIFGDRDGRGLLEASGLEMFYLGEASQVSGPLLQHPLGIASYRDRLYVADTYNNKIKVIDPQSGQVDTLVGGASVPRDATDAGDKADGLSEPGGLSAASGKLYVADTNNHRIRIVDLDRVAADGGNAVTTLTIKGLEPPAGEPPTAK